MKVSYLPSDFRSDLITPVYPTQEKTTEVMNTHYLKRSRDLVGDNAILLMGQIEELLAKQKILLPANSWFIGDHVKGTQIYMIKQIPSFEALNVGFVPFMQEEKPLAFWDGIIVDLDRPDFLVTNHSIRDELIVNAPIKFEVDSLVVSSVNRGVMQDYLNETLFFNDNELILPYSDAPVVRIWSYNGKIYISTRSRIDAADFKITPTKTVLQVWQDLSNGFSVEELFVETTDYVFVLQLNAPELVIHTHLPPDHYFIVELFRMPIYPTEAPIPTVQMKRPSILSIEAANHWLGFTSPADPRLTNGNAVMIIHPKNETVLLKSVAYAWRSDLIGTININTSWSKRFLEICDNRLLTPEQYASIYPILKPSVEKASERLENTAEIWTIISPPYLKEEASKALEKFWGPNGEIAQLPEYIINHPETLRDKSALISKMISQMYNKLGKKAERMPREKILTKILFNSNPQLPYIPGFLLYSLIKAMKCFKKVEEHLRKKTQTSEELQILQE